MNLFQKNKHFFSFLLTKLMRYFCSFWGWDFFSFTKMKSSVTQCPTSTHPAKKLTLACIACLWFYCLSSPLFLLLTLFVAIILSTVFFSLLCLVFLFSWILCIARSLLRLNISFKSCTMLFSSLFDFQVNIYLIVCFNLSLFPIFESSPLFFSLTF